MEQVKRRRADKPAEAPTPTTTADVAKAIFKALADKDLDAVGEFIDPDAVDDFLPIGEFHGWEAIRSFFAELFAAFPDFELEVERVTADEATAVVQWIARGTFDGGQFQGIEPTGASASVRGVDVMQIEGGRLRHNTIYYDGATFARQIGLLPPRGSRTDRAMLAAFNARTRVRQRLRTRQARSA